MPEALQNEIDRMFRVSDLLVTAHSTLRDRYAFRQRATDIILLAGGALVAAFTFLDPAVARILLPSALPVPAIVGLAGIGIFVASLVQMKMDWNGRSALHRRAAEAYLSIKHELGRARCSSEEGARYVEAFTRIRDHYEGIGAASIPVPDRLFPRLEQIHRLKVEVSKALDQRPGASILLLRWKFWWRDTIRGGKS
jgi:hypothetical protein